MKTHCKNGHKWTVKSIYINPRGHKECRICRNKSVTKFRNQNENKFFLDFPWLRAFYGAKLRCTSKKRKKYSRYGGRGIKFLMTKDDFKYLWFRDEAYKLKRPSIDRIDNDGNYLLKNCRFIEHSKNARLGAIYQFKNNLYHLKERSDNNV